MYCRNCAKDLSDKAIACPGCGVSPKTRTSFCPHCGKPTTAVQILCTAFGVGLSTPKQKSRVAAGILGLLLRAFGAHKFYLLGAVAFGYAQSKTYKYTCPKCNRVAEYSEPKPGVKCPSGDGWVMNSAK